MSILEQLRKLEEENSAGDTTEQTQTEEETSTETSEQTESTKQQTSTETSTDSTATESQEQTSTEEQVTKEPKKLELDVYDFLSKNKETVLKVLEKDKDYSSYDKEDLIRLKLEKENPEWDKDDIEAELEDKYAIGLEKVVIDKETMDADEIKEAQALNKRIESAERALKKDAKSAVDYLKGLTADVELPKFEYTFDEEATPAKPEDIITQYEQQLAEQGKKVREEQWIPELQKALPNLNSLKKEVKYIDNENEVVLNVDYKPSEAEKTELLAYLSNYQPQQSDSQYVKEDGSTDVDRFLQDKANSYFSDKINRTIAKEAAAKARQDFVKNKVVNYTEEARDTNISETGDDFENFMKAKAKQKSY